MGIRERNDRGVMSGKQSKKHSDRWRLGDRKTPSPTKMSSQSLKLVSFEASFSSAEEPHNLGDFVTVDDEEYMVLTIETVTFDQDKLIVSYVAQALFERSQEKAKYVSEPSVGWEHFELTFPFVECEEALKRYQLGKMIKRNGVFAKIVEYTHIYNESGLIVIGCWTKPIQPYSQKEIAEARLYSDTPGGSPNV